MRLIDADALPRKKQLEAFGNGQYEDVEIVYGNDIDNAPTVDAVPKQHLVNWAYVVRCAECFMRADCKAAVFYGDDGFCSIGKKAGDDE